MKTLAMIVTRGTYNNILQACQLARIAAEAGTRVSILFRDEAVARLTVDKVHELTFTEAYRGREVKVRNLWKDRKLHDLSLLLREIKERGDTKFSICRDSIEYFDIPVEKLIPELDEVQRVEAFWKEAVANADQVLTF